MKTETTFTAFPYWKRYFYMNKGILLFILPLSITISFILPIITVFIFVWWIPLLTVLIHHFGKRTNMVQIINDEIYVYKKPGKYIFKI